MNVVIIRGGGDLATGVAQKFFRSGFELLVLEVEKPMAIRRNVALCEAVYDGYSKVEDIYCRCIEDISQIKDCFNKGIIPLMIDPLGNSIKQLKPKAVVDAIIAKKNLGTNMEMAPITIGLGPGFRAGKDVNAVIETMRGHDLGRLILNGSAQANTGVPGLLAGKSSQRVIHAPIKGKVEHLRQIGDAVEKGEAICKIGPQVVSASISGRLRGLIRAGLEVPQGLKIADIDPRLDVDWRTISDKARCLGGAALEAFLYLKKTSELGET